MSFPLLNKMMLVLLSSRAQSRLSVGSQLRSTRQTDLRKRHWILNSWNWFVFLRFQKQHKNFKILFFILQKCWNELKMTVKKLFMVEKSFVYLSVSSHGRNNYNVLFLVMVMVLFSSSTKEPCNSSPVIVPTKEESSHGSFRCSDSYRRRTGCVVTCYTWDFSPDASGSKWQVYVIDIVQKALLINSSVWHSVPFVIASPVRLL